MNIKTLISLFFITALFSCSTSKEEIRNTTITTIKGEDIELRNALRRKGRKLKRQNRHKGRLLGQIASKKKTTVHIDSCNVNQ